MIRALPLTLLVLLAACRTPAGPVPGAATSEAAVAQFVAAARAQDMQAMSAVWGNNESPTRDRVSRQELERRLLIINCHLKHDESRIGPSQAGEAGRLVHSVDLKRGTIAGATTFTTVRNTKSQRWFVEDLDLRPLAPFCVQPEKR